MTGKVKLYELAKELGVDGQHLVDVTQRLGIDVKSTTSLLGSEEVRAVREHFNRQRVLSGKGPAAPAPGGKVPSPVSEKRVGATVIRRRASPNAPPPVEPPAPVVEAAAPIAEPDAEPEQEIVAAEVAQEEEAPSLELSQDDAVPAEEPPVEEVQEEIMASQEVEPPAPAPGPVATGAPVRETREVARPAPVNARRKFFPSIVKRTSTEQHLGETIGPKVERKPRPMGSPPIPGQPPRLRTHTPGAPSTVPSGMRRLKEVDVIPQLPSAAEAAKEAAKRRTPGRQEGGVFRSTDYLRRELVHATKKKKAGTRPSLKTQITKAAAHKRVVVMGEAILVSEFAQQMGVKGTQVVSKLFASGVTAGLNQPVDFDTATLIAQEFGFEVRQDTFKEVEVLGSVDMDAEQLEPRAPVVTIMGHVDHGKTSLLDALRKTTVAAGEAGGITQHVGAYQVTVPKGTVTFIDTPGHEAFTAMRARGAKVTDIVILVVSATDGPMPQTLESISHAKAAGVPIIVAVNKIDLPDANPEKVKQTLVGHGLTPEEWGGDTIFVNVSAKTGAALDKLLESVLLQAEILELKANWKTAARGTVVEAKLDKTRGPVTTILVQHGVLKTGDFFVSGSVSGKVRAMADSNGKRITEATPSMPAEVLGFSEVPTVGDEFIVATDDKSAKEVASSRADKARLPMSARGKMTLEEMFGNAADANMKELRVILKTDVQGSMEALREAFKKLPTDKVKTKLLHVAAGGITESDVMLAAASRAVILGFNVRPDVKAQKLAEAQDVTVRSFTIIYELLDEARNLLEGQLDATIRERVIGRAEVRELFVVPKIGTIAGTAVIDGKVVRGCYLRLLRDSRIIHEGKISSLRRFKEDVKEVAQGFECGIGIENYNDVKLGDQFEAYLKEEVKGVL